MGESEKEETQVKKILSLLLAAMMLLSACALAEGQADKLDFADGNFAFLGLDTSLGNADKKATLSVEDYNGGKALRITTRGAVPYVALNVAGLLGEKMNDVRTITFDVGAELDENGKFHAQSGSVILVNGEDNSKTSFPWSVYLARKNPKQAVITIKDDQAMQLERGDYLMITKETDTYTEVNKGADPLDIFISNIQFKDAQGNVLPLDLTAVYESASKEEDRTNLSNVTNAVALEGLPVSEGGWSQNGVDMSDDFRAALVPGSVIEIAYESEDGTMWLVFPDGDAGWSRIASGGMAAINSEKNIAQVTFEQIAEVLGNDPATWGGRIQCESKSSWTVYSIKVGTKSPRIALSEAVSFEGFECSEEGWSQNGFDIPEEILAALVPGSVVQIDFESDENDMWLVFPDADAGWSRVAKDEAVIIGNKAYVTFEQIAAALGEDTSTWGGRLQCESRGNWHVYAVTVGKLNKLYGSYNNVEFEGVTCSEEGWSQNGTDMTEEFRAALVPGSVINISFESETEYMWIVMPDGDAGWNRIESKTADTDGKITQITYEEIAAVMGEDAATWGGRMQFESNGNWTVYTVTVGMAQ